MLTNPQLFLDLALPALRKDFFNRDGMILPAKLNVKYGTYEQHMPWYAARAAEVGADATTTTDRFSGRVKLILLTPKLLDPTWGEEVDTEGYHLAGTLAHELVHAAINGNRPGYIGDLLGKDSHDDPKFIDAVRNMGLIGPPCCTTAGPKFRQWLDEKVRPQYEEHANAQRDTGVPARRRKATRSAAKKVEAAQG